MNQKTLDFVSIVWLFIVMIVCGFAMFTFGATKTIEEMKVNVDGNKIIITVYGEEYIHEIEAE